MSEMMSNERPDRFVPPPAGPPTPVKFPPISRSVLSNGLKVWSIAHQAIPVASVSLVLDAGAAHDPAGRAGLAGVTAHVADEGAGGRDAIQLAEAFASVGTHLDVEIGSDVTALSFTSLTRFFERSLRLLADIASKPHLEAADLERVRELRLNRLRQLSRTAGTVADRAFIGAVFGSHPYGHGVLGTSAALQAMTLDDVRRFHASVWRPANATLIVVGEFPHEQVLQFAEGAFGAWQPAAFDAVETVQVVPARVDPRILLVDRPGAPQSELRLGHVAPARRVDGFHAMVTLNAMLGGEFTSRLNRNLRQTKGLTYGARSAFDLRRAGGSFIAQTSVQTDGTAVAVSEILRECAEIRVPGDIQAAELDQAKYSLTRGYVRNFEAGEELLRAATQLLAYGLADDTFDRFVPTVSAMTADAVTAAAIAHIRPDEMTVIVTGDAATCRGPLEALGREVALVAPEF